jgi:NAD(P)H-hydrate epimerase
MIQLTRAQVREIDRRSLEDYHIPGVVLMENAARAATNVAMQMLHDRPGEVLIFCGGGNNGGDGLAVARHLHNHNIEVYITLTVDPATYKNEAKANWDIIQAMKLPTAQIGGRGSVRAVAQRPSLIVDAIFGTGLTSTPRDPFPTLVDEIHSLNIPILSIDLPSGLDCYTGKPLGACIRATQTITFVAEKIGFANPEARAYLGKITVGDIGCPRELVSNV